MRSLNGSFFIYGKSGTQVSCSLFIFIILKPKEAERRIFMSAIIHVMGRVTKDPAMQQGKNNGSEYISLDLASSQRSQNTQNGQNGYESMFYQCYFNKFLRLPS